MGRPTPTAVPRWEQGTYDYAVPPVPQFVPMSAVPRAAYRTQDDTDSASPVVVPDQAAPLSDQVPQPVALTPPITSAPVVEKPEPRKYTRREFATLTDAITAVRDYCHVAKLYLPNTPQQYVDFPHVLTDETRQLFTGMNRRQLKALTSSAHRKAKELAEDIADAHKATDWRFSCRRRGFRPETDSWQENAVRHLEDRYDSME